MTKEEWNLLLNDNSYYYRKGYHIKLEDMNKYILEFYRELYELLKKVNIDFREEIDENKILMGFAQEECDSPFGDKLYTTFHVWAKLKIPYYAMKKLSTYFYEMRLQY